MDIGSVRPVVPGLSVPVPRAPAAAEQAASTDLPVGSAVVKSDGTAYAGNNARGKTNQDVPNPLDVRSTVTVDKEADAVVYKQIDEITGNVVSQIPDESRLRMRAMINAWTEAMHGQTSSASTLA
ncbi:hypothetical protein [Pleomorphomonas oryzae]|uniref:hypothetical protein n=1 Tax=Pleomorphomonas oryzae TaxID=261934 RepID=UPI00047A5D4A|nr:hypothetical protein [Pleomorphomonas oryzae]